MPVETMTLATRIVVLANKGIAQVGTPLELYETPNNEFVAEFIGSPAMNLLPGKISQTGAQTTVALDNGGIAVTEISTSEADLGKTVNVGARPEDFVQTDGDHIFKSEVDIVAALGEVILATSRKTIAKNRSSQSYPAFIMNYVAKHWV